MSAMIKRIRLHNFRNFSSFEAAFDSKINLIIGPNAIGKTSLLEAIHFLSTGRSFRTPHLHELIRHGESSFFLEAEFLENGVTSSLQVSYDGSKRKVIHNATTYHNFSSLLGLLPSTVLTPGDSELITGSPSYRRRFLNLYLAQQQPLYLYHLARYSRALKQRNALLKMGQTRGVEAFEGPMAVAAGFLTGEREKALQAIETQAEGFLRRLAPDSEELSLRYHPAIAKEGYAKSRKKELEAKTTLYGPHRDDFSIQLSKKEAKGFASEGQKRSIVAALKLAEVKSGAIFGIDDFGVHLDQIRKEALLEEIQTLNQVFLTVPEKIAIDSKCIELAQVSLT
ncbi:MAG: DNA replication/repair protein RecF [Candidatus Algichlamydia australiensis]|nr:DNA replication/repair protein RecF [Chlamydiales bacterium]